MVRIKDIADQAGVSPTTVSNVIHGNTKRVSPKTIEKIQKILQESNYVPSMAARLLSQTNSNIIGVIIAYAKNKDRRVVQDPFISEILGALEEDIRNSGYFMMLYAAEETIDIFKLASTWKVAGLIILGFNEKDCINLQKQTAAPFVTVDSYFEKNNKKEFVNVGLNDYDGGYIMGKYLVENGHKKILFLADNDLGVDHHRRMGFFHALKEADIPCDETNFILVDKNDKERRQQYSSLLSQFKKQTALFCASDYYAVECINFLQEEGVQVPEDVSVAGFDDSIFAGMIRPKLTTIRQDISMKAATALENLLYLIDGNGHLIKERDKKLPVKLVCRNSVKQIVN